MLSEADVTRALSAVIDPEIGVNIVDLGLVYSVAVEGAGVDVKMTMTTPACPLHEYLVDSSESAIRREFPEVESVRVELVWSPPWQPAMMSEAARRQLSYG